MSLSTNLVAGLSSGFDWRSMIDQLMEIEHKKVDLVEDQKTEYEDKLSEWQSFNTKLLSLKTVAADLSNTEDFDIYTSDMTSNSSTVEGSDLLSVSATSSASKGSYTITVSSLATAQKLSSGSFSGFSDALGASYTGDILINGVAISVNPTDTLASVRNKINNANAGTDPTGVTASIVSYGANDYRLLLTSDTTGEDGIGLKNASASDLVELFGWKDNTSLLKNSITGGAQSDSFSDSTQDVKTLLGISTTQTGSIQIKDGNDAYQSVNIDFSTDSIEDIKTAINNASIAGVTASIITDTSGTTTTYKLQIDGSQDFVDAQNILETLGVIHNGKSAVQGTTSDTSMTVDGEYVDADALITEIDGYNQFADGDKISLGVSSTDHSGNSVSGDILTITTSTTVQDLLDAIETAYEANGDEVSVYVTSDGKIEVTDLEEGTSGLVVALESTIGDSSYSSLDWGTFTALGEVRKRELVAGADASIIVDGVTTTSADNTVDGVLPGVTLNLLKADADTTITLNVDRDLDAIMEKISAFVDTYNEVMTYIHQQQSYDNDDEETGGTLFGDGTLSSVKSDITSTLIQSVWGVSSEYSMMGLVGINLDNEGQLSIDSDKLEGYLKTNFNDVRNLFAANGSTNGGTLEYISHSRDTEAAEYTVNITTAAIQSTSTSDNGTVGEDETLTITDGDKVAEIDLTTDMTLSGIKNAINSEMSKVYTEKLIGDTQLYEGSGGTAALSSATTWDQVYIDASNSANLADNDVISFSGSSRSVGDVDGSYAISDVSTDSVQGLLSAIESAYGNGITAKVDSSGQIVLTEKSSGNSQISITFDYSQAHNLSFGSSVSTTNAGGQEGRYAMDITATDDGSGHLVLTHDNYGNDYSFTISEDASSGNKLWTGGDQTVNNGVDVAGTINGEATTGSGQILKGDDGENHIEGLVIKYTGTAEGLDVGEIKLTLGTAALFDRVLFNITDSYEGYVAFKQDSLQNSIDSFDTRIEEMEARLDLKMENMINKFVAMESALSVMQSQSEWLTGQINASYSGWG